MRIAEYQQVGTESVTRNRWVVDIEADELNSTDEQGHREEYIEDVPVMGLVYRDATPEEDAEAARIAAEMPEITPTNEERISDLEELVTILAGVIAND